MITDESQKYKYCCAVRAGKDKWFDCKSCSKSGAFCSWQKSKQECTSNGYDQDCEWINNSCYNKKGVYAEQIACDDSIGFGKCMTNDFVFSYYDSSK
jgi:hypothetical protein